MGGFARRWWPLLALALLLAALQGKLWLGDGGLPDARALRQNVEQQRAENKKLQERNDALSAEVEDLKSRYRAGKVGDVEVKTKLAKAINAYLEPIRDRRAAALAKPGYLKDVLFEGSKKARAVAIETMARVRDAVKLKY